jgi:hypothetical protein
MRVRIAVPEDHVNPHVIDAALEAVTRLDESLIRSGESPTADQALAKGAIWRPEPMGDEHFDHGGTIASRGWGDCDDWAPLQAATLRASGEDTGAVARVVPSGPNTFHAMVQRSDGQLESGERDISVRAGMKPLRNATAVIGGAETIDIQACDPHDGRIYHGSLAPTVGPMTMHCGPALAVRGVAGCFQGRCDLPVSGSPLMTVRGRRGIRRVRGGLPYAFSSTALAGSPLEALSGAIVGAVMCGDASELSTSLDRYKLLAMQAAMSGMAPQQIAESLVAHMAEEIPQEASALGSDPDEALGRLLADLHAQGFIPSGLAVHDTSHAIWCAAAGITRAVAPTVNRLGPALGFAPWGAPPGGRPFHPGAGTV